MDRAPDRILVAVRQAWLVRPAARPILSMGGQTFFPPIVHFQRLPAVVSRMFEAFPAAASCMLYRRGQRWRDSPHPLNEHHVRPLSVFQSVALSAVMGERQTSSRHPTGWREGGGASPAALGYCHEMRAAARGPSASLSGGTSSATSCCRRASGDKHSRAPH
jgi:hypothetical protein